MKRSETMGADNCGCAIKIIYEHYVGDDGDQWDIVGVEVTKHCVAHDRIRIYARDDPEYDWDI